MRSDKLIERYKKEGALLRGHFILSSGMHSEWYLQSALFLARPEEAEAALTTLGALLAPFKPDLVVSPAVGGIVAGQETARALGKRAFFAERAGGRFVLRRGFRIEPGERVVVVEDVVTTGGSVREVLDLVGAVGGRPVAVGALIDRSDGRVSFPVPFQALAKIAFPVWPAERCPLCREGKPVRRPGSAGANSR